MVLGMRRTGGLIVILAVTLAAALWIPLTLGAQEMNKAALVILYAENDARTVCVEFEEDQISGYELLQRSGIDLNIGAQGIGTLVCSIDNTGCPASDCLCQCKGGGECIYWSYWHRVDETWQYSQGGSSVYVVEPGAVEGWSWGPGAISQAIPPPDTDYAEVCDAAPSTTLQTTSTIARNSQLTVQNSSKTSSAIADIVPGQDVVASPISYLVALIIVASLGVMFLLTSIRRKHQNQ